MSNADRISTTGKADEAEITLGILNAIHENERITQRTVAQDLGIALGLTNAYLKRCVKKGLIKVSQAPANLPRFFRSKCHGRTVTNIDVTYLRPPVYQKSFWKLSVPN